MCGIGRKIIILEKKNKGTDRRFLFYLFYIYFYAIISYFKRAGRGFGDR